MPSSASRVDRFAQSARRFMCCMYVQEFYVLWTVTVLSCVRLCPCASGTIHAGLSRHGLLVSVRGVTYDSKRVKSLLIGYSSAQDRHTMGHTRLIDSRARSRDKQDSRLKTVFGRLGSGSMCTDKQETHTCTRVGLSVHCCLICLGHL